MFFQLFSTIKVNLVAKIMQSAYLCVIFHVKHKKSPFIAHLTWFLILGKIQQGGQDGVHCWLRHRPPAAPPPIKYTSSCREDQRLSIQLARGSREFTCFCLHKKWMPRSYLRGGGEVGGGGESEGLLAGAFAPFDLFHNGVTSFRVLNMWRTLSNKESIEKMAWKKSDSVYVVRAYDYGFCR